MATPVWLLIGTIIGVALAMEIPSRLRDERLRPVARWITVTLTGLFSIGYLVGLTLGTFTAVSVVLATLIVVAVGFAAYVSLKANLGLRPVVVAVVGLLLSTLGFVALIDGSLRVGGVEFLLDRNAQELDRSSPQEQTYWDLIMDRERILTEVSGPPQAEEAIGVALLVAGLIETGSAAILAGSRYYWHLRRRVASDS